MPRPARAVFECPAVTNGSLLRYAQKLIDNQGVLYHAVSPVTTASAGYAVLPRTGALSTGLVACVETSAPPPESVPATVLGDPMKVKKI
mmetsp:Transcript_1038/g.1813  ORF Transcript_1038/g.1813 Transcript_1038/m.1813 type:complete len:89 (-) Transcript_1038:143-409(-)